MSSAQPLRWIGVALGAAIAVYFIYSHLPYFGNVSFLGGLLLAEVLIAGVWRYERRFLVLLMVAFLWAGMNVPLESNWTSGRWLVLGIGAVAGFVVWMKSPHGSLRVFHLVAFFCVGAAFVSATVSPFPQMASLKALSLLLLMLYCTFGARLAIFGREERFFRGLLFAAEVAVYGTAICYFVVGAAVWGNPNSLGAAMSIGVFPVLLWGWRASDRPIQRFRRLVALLLCSYLIVFSMARAAMISMFLVTLVFCFCLHQYKLLLKMTGVILCLAAVAGMFAPRTFNKSLTDMKDAALYKGHKQDGLLGSRQTPWEKTIATIKENPWFGTGYGTSPSGEDPGLSFGRFSSTAETAREHGSSYMTIAEWVGLLGGVPFLALLALTMWNVLRVCAWMNRALDPRHHSIPLALVVFAGLVHASFEDWLFAVGAYPCVYFWVFAFLLADLSPAAVVVPSPSARDPFMVSPAAFGAVVPHR